MIKKILLVLLILLSSCEKDDICSETNTTPRVVLDFYDLSNPTELKSVPGLMVFGLNDDNELVGISNEIVMTRNTVNLPLRNNNTETRFVLYRNYELIDNEIFGNPDIIKLTYSSSAIYVSRACGYKLNYELLTFGKESDSDNWAFNTEILTLSITSESETHVKIMH